MELEKKQEQEAYTVHIDFIDGTSKDVEAFDHPVEGMYGYMPAKEVFYVFQAYPIHVKAYFPREFVKTIMLIG